MNGALIIAAAESKMGPYVVRTVANRAADALPTSLLVSVLYMALALLVVASLVGVLGMGLVYAERKIAGHFQARLGPMRVGPHGIFQTLADSLKLLFKEDIVPFKADRAMHLRTGDPEGHLRVRRRSDAGSDCRRHLRRRQSDHRGG